MPETLVLSGPDVSAVVRAVGVDEFMERMIETLEDGLASLRPTEMPARSGLRPRPDGGLIEWMPVSADGSATIKIVGYHPANPILTTLPSVTGTIARFDVATGALLALADGALLTAVRTGAASAVATRALTGRRPSVLAIIGCGAQGVTQCHALDLVFSFDEILCLDIDPATEHSFSQRVPRGGARTRPASIQEISDRADVICTATSSPAGSPAVLRRVGGASHINAVGSDSPGKIEVDADILRAGTVVPDFLEQARTEGECQQLSASQIGPDLPTVLRLPREDRPGGLTIFDSTGCASEDHLALDVLLDFAAEFGIGRRIPLYPHAADPKSPYGALVSGVAEEDQNHLSLAKLA